MRLLFAAMMMVCGAAQAEVTVLTTGAFKAVAVAVAAPFEAEVGQPVRITNDTAGGVLRIVRGGAAFDVVVLTAGALRTLADEGKVVSDTQVDLARVGVGVAIRAGAAKPDISTAAAFRAALLAAPRVAIIDPAAGGTSGIYLMQLFDRLSIGPQMRAKLVLVPGGLTADRVADGTADMAVQQISELGVPGTQFVGPLPDEVQTYTTYSGAVGSAAKEPEQARAYLRALAGPEAGKVLAERGMVRP